MEEKKRKKKSASVEIEKAEEEVETRAKKHENKKVKKRKSDDLVLEDHDIEDKKAKKKKRKENVNGSETGIKKAKKRTSKTDTKDGREDTNSIHDELNYSEGDSTETTKEKHRVKSSKAKRNEDKSLSQSDEILIQDEVLVRKKKKDKIKKDKIKTPKVIETETAEVDKKSSGVEALLYLKVWKKDRCNWTFKKVRQVWLLRHMFDRSMIPDKAFGVLLLYLEGLQGLARKTTISRAEAMIESDEDVKQPEGFDLERVKKLLQILT